VKKTVGNEKNLKKFGIDKPPANPTPEQKRAGWEKKRNLWYWINFYQKLSFNKFKETAQDLAQNGNNYNLYQVQAMRYIEKSMRADPRFMMDFLDRTEGKAVQKIENSGEQKLIIEKVIKNPESSVKSDNEITT
jgi:hypothetical protein